MSHPRAILFDKDGTLFDFQATWGQFTATVIADLSGGDAVLAEVLADEIGFDADTLRLRPGSVVIAGTPAEVAEAFLPHLPTPPARSDLIGHLDLRAAGAELAEAVPLDAFFDSLTGAGYATAVITNDAEAPARAHLESVGVLDRIGFLAGYDSGHGAKPAPGQLLAACLALGVPPEAAVMVGDSTHDLLAGRAAGCRTVGVLTGVAKTAELSPYADAVLPDIGHLPGWLSDLSG